MEVVFKKNFIHDLDVSISILVGEESGMNLEYLAIFCLMTPSWILACEDHGILSMGMKVRVFL